MFRKRFYSKYNKLWIFGTGTLLALLAYLTALGYYGIEITYSGDVKCAGNELEPCISYFNITVPNFSLCFGNTINVLYFDKEKNVKWELYIKHNQSPGRQYCTYGRKYLEWVHVKDDLYYCPSPTKQNDFTKQYQRCERLSKSGKLCYRKGGEVELPFDFRGKCLEAGKTHRFKLVGYKPMNETVKWGLVAGGKHIDPKWIGYAADDFFVKLIKSKPSLTYAEVEYEIANPTGFDIRLPKEALGLVFKEVSGKIERFDTKIYEKTIETIRIPVYETVCENVTVTANLTNVTQKVCTHVVKDYKLQQRIVWKEANLTDFVLKPGKRYRVWHKLYYDKPAFRRRIEIDWKPTVKIGNIKYIQHKWTWLNASWNYRREIAITSQGAGDLTDYQIEIVHNFSSEYSAGKIQQYCEDLRFTYYNATSDTETEIPYWIEECNLTANDNATVWIKVPFIGNTSTETVYMYYGNPDATSESSTTNTFIREIDGVVGSWHFDEGSGTTAYDSSGNDNDGTLINGPTWVDGKFGKALQYDGSDDYVEVPDSTSLDIPEGSKISITAWVKADAFNTPNLILAKATSGSKGNYHFGVHNGQYLYFSFYNGGWRELRDDTTPLSTGTWYFVAVTFDSSTDECKLYINGNNVKTGSIPYDLITNDESLTIARYLGGGNPWDGIIDELHIYNKILTQEEISDLYNNYGYTTENYPGKVLTRKFTDPEPTYEVKSEEYNPNAAILYLNGRTTDVNYELGTVANLSAELIYVGENMIAWWRFDNGSGTVAYDYFKRNNGTIYGATWTEDTAFGKGYALEFDGNDYVKIENSPSLTSFPDYTILLWIYPTGSGHLFTKDVAGNYYDLEFSLESDGRLKYQNERGGSQVNLYSTHSVRWNDWNLVGVQYDNSTQKLRFIVNGIIEEQTCENCWIDNSAFIAIGARSLSGETTVSNYFEGIIDEVRIYRASINLMKIMQEFDNIVGYWKFDEAYGNTTYDSSGEGNDGTLYPQPDDPYLKDGFETWNSWIRSRDCQVVEQSSSTVYEGSYSMHILYNTSASTDDYGYVRWDWGTEENWGDYEYIAFWVYCDNCTDITDFHLILYNADESEISHYPNVIDKIAKNGYWKWIVYRWDEGDNDAVWDSVADMRFVIANSDTGDTGLIKHFYIDHVILIDVDYPPERQGHIVENFDRFKDYTPLFALSGWEEIGNDGANNECNKGNVGPGNFWYFCDGQICGYQPNCDFGMGLTPYYVSDDYKISLRRYGWRDDFAVVFGYDKSTGKGFKVWFGYNNFKIYDKDGTILNSSTTNQPTTGRYWYILNVTVVGNQITAEVFFDNGTMLENGILTATTSYDTSGYVGFYGESHHIIDDLEIIPLRGFGAAKFGSALQFDGVDDYVRIPYSESLDLYDSDITVTGWVKGTGNAFGKAFCWRWTYGMTVFSDKLRVQLTNSSGTTFNYYKSGTFDQNTWNFIAFTLEQDTQKLKIYINGESPTIIDLPDYVLPLASGTSGCCHGWFMIGRHCAPSDFFNGTIDEVRIYNRALSEEEIQNIYEGYTSAVYRRKIANYTICLDIDQNDYGTNYVCGNGTVQYGFTTNAAKNTFSDGSTSKTLTYTSAPENQTVYIPVNKWDEIVSAFLNLTGIETNGQYPTNISLYVDDELDQKFYGQLMGDKIYLNFFENTSTAENISFEQSGIQSRYLLLPNLTIISATLDLAGHPITGWYAGNELGIEMESVSVTGDCIPESDFSDWIIYGGTKLYDCPNQTLSATAVFNISKLVESINFGYGHYCHPSWNAERINISLEEYNFTGNKWHLLKQINHECTSNYKKCFDVNVPILIHPDFESNNRRRFRMKLELSKDSSPGASSIVYDLCLFTGFTQSNSNLWFYRFEKVSYPYNPTVDVADSGKPYEFSWNGELREVNGTQTVDLNVTLINNYLATCNYDEEGICKVPVVFGSETPGKLEWTNLNITYTVSPYQLDSNLLAAYQSEHTETDQNIPIHIQSETNSTIMAKLNLTYYGTDTVPVTAHPFGSSEGDTLSAHVYYSRFNYSFPKNIEYIEFIPKTPSDKNVPAFGQTWKQPILNFTVLAYDKPVNLSIKINETFPCVNLTASSTNAKSEGRMLNESWFTFATNLSQFDTASLWMWADFDCSYAQWYLWNPEFYFRACCYDCICSEEVS